MRGHALRLTLCDARKLVFALGVLVAAPACNGDRTESRAPARTETRSAPTTVRPPAPGPVDISALRRAAPARLIAIGDLHGDVDATRRALKIAGVVDDRDRWTGGDAVVVQTGDQLDRGDDEPEILDLLENLGREAKAAGGDVVVLNGNHEVMNVLGDFRYVTEDGFRDFQGEAGRASAFAPGAPIAKRLAKRSIAAIVGGTAFAHGGILPEHVAGLAKLDADVRAWMAGNVDEAAAQTTIAAIMDQDGPIWTRVYADDGEEVCRRLDEALKSMDAKRMVVGHTVQKNGITSACEGRLWRIDVGLAKHYGGPTQVLEIRGDEVTVLPGSAAPAP